MNKIINIFNDMILQYQEEICKKNPSISVKQLQEIWEQINNEKDLKLNTNEKEIKTKKKKTAYQNFFVIARKEVTTENPNLKFGEISKIISTKWNSMTSSEKKEYETKENDIMENYKQKDNKNNNYIHLHLFENDDDDKECNRIDYEEDEDDINIEDDEDDDDDDEINFDDME